MLAGLCLCFAAAQGEESSNVSHVLQRFENGDEMQEVVVCGIVDPAFDWDCIV